MNSAQSVFTVLSMSLKGNRFTRSLTTCVNDRKFYDKSEKLRFNIKRAASSYEQAKSFRSIPGPQPFFGTFPKYLSSNFKDKDISNVVFAPMYEKYGDIVREKIAFNMNIVHIFNPDETESTLRNEDAKGKPTSMVLEFFKAAKRYRKLRKHPDFDEKSDEHLQKISAMRHIMLRPQSVAQFYLPVSQVAKDFVQYIRRIRDENMVVHNVHEQLQRYAAEVISTLVLYERAGMFENKPGSDELLKALSSMLINEHKYNQFSLDRGKVFKEITKNYDYMNKLVEEAVADVEKKLEKDKNKTSGNMTFLETVVQVPTLTKKQKEDIAATVLFAGVENTGNTLITMFYLLTKNMDVQEALHNEITQNFNGGTSLVTKDDLEEMKYMKSIVKETNRVLPIAFTMVRVLSEDTVIKGYQIPKGTRCLFHSKVMSNSSEYLDEPEKFKPERWLRGSKEQVHPFLSLPFGYGIRGCLGRRFAEQEMYALLAEVFYNFRVEYDGPDMHHVSKMSQYPDRVLDMKFVDRK